MDDIAVRLNTERAILADEWMPSDATDVEKLAAHQKLIADAIDKFGADNLISVLIDELIRERNKRQMSEDEVLNIKNDCQRTRGENDAYRSVIVQALCGELHER